MLNRGLDYLKMGDIAAARLVLRRAAGAGSAQAALALGATYDPVMLGEIGAVGLTGDAAQARTWYELAGQLGSAEAASRIARLAP